MLEMCGLMVLQEGLERQWGLGWSQSHPGWIRVVKPVTLPCVSLWGCPQSQPSLVLEVSSLTQSGLIMNPHPSAAVMGEGIVT